MTYPDSIVFGASGFIGRHLVAELLDRGNTVAAAVRPGSRARLESWLDARNADKARLMILQGDITRPDLGLPAAALLDEVRDVYNSAARMAFGLTAEEARSVNVTGALNVLDWAARRPSLRRVVHITGYRVDVKDSGEASYENGAYAASKFEAHTALQERASARSIPLTIANPSTVVGPDQYTGLAELVRDMWRGKLAALPGRADTFVPLVDAGYFAQFLASVPSHAETEGRTYTVLDQATPNLPDLVALVASHLGVRAPRFLLPTGLINLLPRALTGVDREALQFLASDRYDTTAADAHAKAAGLQMPPIEMVVRDWADHLVASRFGETAAAPAAGFHEGTWIVGDREQPAYVLLHGLPVDSDAWAEVSPLLGAAALRADLPGLGRSAPAPEPLQDWLAGLLRSVTTRPVLVAHSLGCDPAIRFATAHPEKISGLVLISPYFLQQRAPWLVRSSLAALSLRRTSAARLAKLLALPDGTATASAAANLNRPGVARRTVAALRTASVPRRREQLRDLLARVMVPTEIIIGADDPLTVPTDLQVTIIRGTGHYPQISHPRDVSRAIAAHRYAHAGA
jgi:nucleoside-diphosphate-sugar epimerase/pimeloyl-ACP methyl ester carboxylesterase